VRTRVLLLIAVAMGTFIAVQPVSAATTIVRGIQTPVDSGPCFNASAAFSSTMEGGLTGCWWVDTITPDPFDPASYSAGGTAVFSGTEHFTGCVNTNGDADCDPGEPSGTFSTTYTFTAQFDANGNEIHGRCNHPITSGEDGFEGISGVVNFTDVVTTTPPTSPYWGPVRL